MLSESRRQQASRRGLPRQPVLLAVELSSAAKRGRCGVTRNASRTGLLIVTPSRFAVGESLELALHGSPGQSGRVNARVVRVEENEWDSHEVWRYRMAVALDDALPDDLLVSAAERTARTSRLGAA
jgi:hypothetical protein